MIVVDTDVASLIWKRALPLHLVRQLAGRRLYVTFVTIGELTVWSHGRDWGPRKRADFEQWVAGFRVLAYGSGVAKRWSALTAAGRKRGRAPPVNDTWLAAACIDAGLPLATLNTKDFAHHAATRGLRLIGV